MITDDHLRPAHLELEAFATHGLYEYGELELSTAGHLDDLRRRSVADPDRHVAEHFAFETVADLSRRDELPIGACER